MHYTLEMNKTKLRCDCYEGQTGKSMEKSEGPKVAAFTEKGTCK